MTAAKKVANWNPQIVVFACNWCSYAGADTAGVSRIQHQPHFRMIRVMCSGRIQPGFVLRSFEKGADGVLVSGCHFGDCHYIFGNHRAVEQFDKTMNMVKLLGIEEGRLRLEWISAAEGPRFAKVINEFTDEVRELGPSPLRTSRQDSAGRGGMLMQELARQTRAWACYDCGKCTATCPISRAGSPLSPRRHVLATVMGHTEDIHSDEGLNSCLSCSLCDFRCPAEVKYTDLVLELRKMVFNDKVQPDCPHGGALQSVFRMMAKGGTQQNRLDWLTDDLKTERKHGKVFFFTGCTMYYDAFFPEHGLKTLDGTRATVKVLNALGIEPVVSQDEVCCGHDLLWNGDQASFEALAKRNAHLVAESGAKLLLTSCAECARTWRKDYAPFLEAPVQILHITEYLAEHLGELKLNGNGDPEGDVPGPMPARSPPRRLRSAAAGDGGHPRRRAQRDAAFGTAGGMLCRRTVVELRSLRQADPGGATA